MRNAAIITAAVLAIAPSHRAQAEATLYTVTKLFPGPSLDITPTGINDSGAIIGSVSDGEIGILSGTNWTTLNFATPAANQREISVGLKIDDDFDFVGYTAHITGQFTTSPDYSAVYLHDIGATTFNLTPDLDSKAIGVNDTGHVIGYSGDSIYVSTTPFTDPYTAQIHLPVGYEISDLNDDGTIVGTNFHGQNGQDEGFVLHGNTLTAVTVPGAYGTDINGISNSGLIVGSYYDVNHRYEGFVDDHGIFTRIAIPETSELFLEGINDAGNLVGTAFGDGPVGVLLQPTQRIDSDIPGFTGNLPIATDPNLIPDFTLVSQLPLVEFQHVIDVPEPASFALLGAGLVAIGLGRRRRAPTARCGRLGD